MIAVTITASVGALRQRRLGSSDGRGAEKEYAFEMACSNIRYGEGVTREVGMDLINLGIKSTCVFTDKNVCSPPVLLVFIKVIVCPLLYL